MTKQIKDVKILPSLLGADFLDLYSDIKKVEQTNMFLHHIDIMDGHFVQNISFGKTLLDKVIPIMNRGIDIHLMLQNPSQHLPYFITYKPAVITIHSEISEREISNCIELLSRFENIKIGLAFNPNSNLDIINKYITKINLVLIMSVFPGSGGQKFIENSLDRISKAKTIIKNKDIIIEVDGGINTYTSKQAISHGADWLVAGSFLYSSTDYEECVLQLKGKDFI